MPRRQRLSVDALEWLQVGNALRAKRDEPVQVPAPLEDVGHAVVDHLTEVERCRAIQATGSEAEEVVHPRIVFLYRPAPDVSGPLTHQILQAGGGQVVGRAVANDDVVAGVAEDLVGALAANDDVAAVAATEDVGKVVADNDVVGQAADDVLEAADAAGDARNRAQRQVDANAVVCGE